VFYRRLRQDKAWKVLANLSLVTCATILLAIVVLKLAQQGPLHGYVGLIQRIVDQAALPQSGGGAKVTFSLNHSGR
jgi:hypothetical protein